EQAQRTQANIPRNTKATAEVPHPPSRLSHRIPTNKSSNIPSLEIRMTTTPTGYFSSTDGCSTLRQFLGINYLLGHLLLAATWSYTRRHELRLIEHPFTGVGLVGWSIVYTVLWPMVFGISEVALGKVVPVAFLGLLLGAMVSR
nr:hypothetical protein [Escherichia coli]